MADGVTSEPEKRRFPSDVVIALVGAAATTALLVVFDAFEALHNASRHYEAWELDEIIVAIATTSVWMAWLAWRQWKLARKRLQELLSTERALVRSDDKLEFLIAAAPGTFYVREPQGDGQIVYVSPHIETQLGHDAERICRRPHAWMDLVHPDDRNVIQFLRETTLRDGHASGEYRFCHADGRYRWVENHTVLLRDQDGEPEAVIGYIHDSDVQKTFSEELADAVNARTAELSATNRALEQEVAERQTVSAKLRLEQERSARLIANLPGYVYVRNCDGKNNNLRFISGAVKRILGFEPSALIGKNAVDLMELVHPDDRQTLQKAGETLVQLGEAFECEYRIRTADGQQRWLWERMRGVLNTSGRLERIEGYVEDITVRKEMDQALRTSLDRLDIVTNNLPFLVGYADKDGRMLFGNKIWQEWAGKPAEEMVGRPIAEIAKPENYAEIAGMVEDALAGKRASREGPAYLANGDQHIVYRDYIPHFSSDGEPDGFVLLVRDVTEQKQIEEERRVDAERLKQATEVAGLGYYVWDVLEDRCIFCSEEHARLHGLSPEEYIARAATIDEEFCLTHPEDRALVKERVQAMRNGEKVAFEYRILLADKTVRHVSEIIHPAFDSSGRVIREIGTSRDITDDKLAQQARRESERRLKSAAQMAKLGHYVWDLVEDRCLYCSDELARMHGMTAEEYVAASIGASADADRFVHPEDRERYKEELRRTDEEQKPLNIEYRMITADGEVRHVREIEHNLEIANGRILRSEGTVQDVTDVKRAEDSLAESERRLKTAAQMAKLGYFVWDLLEDRCIYCSEELAQIHGLSVDDYMKRATGVEAEANDFLHPDDRERYLEALRDTYNKQQPLNIEYRIIAADGEVRHVREIEHSFLVEDGIPLRSEGTVQDVTEMRLAEQQLQQAHKMEAVGQLTGGLAHDFNNLLTVILGNLQLLERRVADDERAVKRIDTAVHAAQRGAELTKSLLAFSRQQRLEDQPTNLSEAIAQMKRLLKTSVGEQVELDFVLDPELSLTRVDPGQFENALLNLLLNARDALPQGGRITIETQTADLDAEHAAQKPDLQPGRYVVLSVTDNGTGMPRDVQDRIFEPFFTTKDVGRGSGLGLSMVFGFMKQSGGHVTVYSEEGAGTCFSLYFRADDSESVEAPQEPAGVFCPLGRETILVVEDQEDVRETSLATLSGLGYRVLSAENGPSALALLKEHPEIDLLFTDIAMPEGMNGLELADRAVREHPALRVLYTSGFPPAAMSRTRDPERGRNWLTKPYLNQTLAQKVREVLDRS